MFLNFDRRIGGKSQQFKPTVKSIVVRKPQNKATGNLRAILIILLLLNFALDYQCIFRMFVGQLEATQLHFDKTKDGLPLTTIQITDGTVIKL